MQYSPITLTGEGDCLTAGELYFVERRRWEMNQLEMANVLEVSRSSYARVERDELELDDIPDIGELRDVEFCVLMRRRAGMTQAEVALGMGCSRAWVNKMENAVVNCETLTRYWKE